MPRSVTGNGIDWTYYPDGQRAGLSRVFLTPGLTIGRFYLSKTTALTTGIGYQVAITRLSIAPSR
jgi:hypothetical protein